MAKRVSTVLKSIVKENAQKGAHHITTNAKSGSESSKRTTNAKNARRRSSDQPPAPTGKPIMTEPGTKKQTSRSNPVASFAKTTKCKWACAAVALVLVVGMGNAIGGANISSDATTNALVATGELSQSSAAKATDEAAEAEKAAAEKEAAETEARAKADAEAKAKADADAKAAEDAAARAKAAADAKAQAQQEQVQRESATAASTPAPQASQENAARNSGGGGGAAAPAPSSSGGGSGTVYVAASGEGERYHSKPTCGRMKNSIAISLSEAQSRHLTPCGNCY